MEDYKMSKRNMNWNQHKLENFLKEGRGKGKGENYHPWLTIQDMPSQGRVSRVYGYKTNRIHHFFSDMETRVFYLISWEDAVTDIREHYPLLDLESAIQDKKGLDFSKLVDKESGTPYILTTTFLITLRDANNQEYYNARSIKASEKLEHNYIIEHYEVERRYWQSKGVDWGIITQKDINLTRAKNIEWVYPALIDEEIEFETKQELSTELLNYLHNSDNAVRKTTSCFDTNMNVQSGTGLFLFKYLIANKSITVDMDKEIDVNVPFSKLLLR